MKLLSPLVFLALLLQSSLGTAVDCAEPNLLQKQLLLQFEDTVSVGWLLENNGTQLVKLQETIASTYNELSFYSCDTPTFRHILNVSLILDEYDYGTTTQLHQYDYGLTGAAVLAFQLEMSCRNCTNDEPLFDVLTEDAKNSTTSAVKPTLRSAVNQTEISNYSEYCRCPATLPDPLNMEEYLLLMQENLSVQTNESPSVLTAAAFVMLMNQNLMDQQISTTITQSIEVEEVDCSSIVRQFNSIVYMDVDFSGNMFPSKEEVQSLEESFVSTYNFLSFESCDPYFRRISTAKFGFKLDAGTSFDEENMIPVYPIMEERNASFLGNDSTFAVTWNASNSVETWNVTSNFSLPIEGPSKRKIQKAVLTVSAECRNCHINAAGWFTLFDNFIPHQPVGSQGQSLASQGNESIPVVETSRLANGKLRKKITGGLRNFQSYWQPPDNGTACSCPLQHHINETVNSNSSTTSQMTVSEETMLPSYRRNLKQQREGGLIEVVESASNMEEAQLVGCGPNISLFNSNIFTGIRVDPTNITRQQISKLEQAVVDTYNYLAFRTCDGLFRAITEVELTFFHSSRKSSHRRTQLYSKVMGEFFQYHNSRSGFRNSSGSLNNTNTSDGFFVAGSDLGANSTDDSRREFVETFFSIKGECRGCEVSSSGTFNLFDDGFGGRRRLQARELVDESFLYPNKYNKGFPVDPSTCFCLAGVLASTGQGTTSEAFGEALAKELEILDENGDIESMDPTVGDVLEGIQVSCNGEVQDFSSYVYADLGITRSEVTKEVNE